MGRRDNTDMGGIQERFLTTHWSLLQNIQATDEGDRNRALIGLLLERYWKPVYCYLRRQGCGNEEAKDLTQGFFHEVVLNRHLVDRADLAKGSFRSLLLHALRQYLLDERRKEEAQKRIPRERLVPLDIADPPAIVAAVQALDPEESFNYAWKADLMDRALAEVRESYLREGMETHWCVFRDRVLEPVLQEQPAPSLGQICERYGIENEATASHMLLTVKRRFQTVLKDHVRQTVLAGEGVEEEWQEILKLLEKKK
jgi:DNA-directed RNA polymerase specialized sigma24 family protein